MPKKKQIRTDDRVSLTIDPVIRQGIDDYRQWLWDSDTQQSCSDPSALRALARYGAAVMARRLARQRQAKAQAQKQKEKEA